MINIPSRENRYFVSKRQNRNEGATQPKYIKKSQDRDFHFSTFATGILSSLRSVVMLI